jgi:signal transduction histidine kinase
MSARLSKSQEELNSVLKPAVDRVRVRELFEESQSKIFGRTDRLFATLMVIQWLAGIGAALWLSPRTWAGSSSEVHWHVWAAILLGGCITGFPVLLAWKQPGASSTRHVVAIGQMLTSALLIHLTGGRIETHFHVFGSLAFLAFYRDWRVLMTATIVVAADHLARGLFWPQSVFGVLSISWWRPLEHAGWVLFEDIFLLIAIRQRGTDLMEMAERRASLETANATLENQYRQRTADLEITRESLLQATHQAGMAEMASGILHNVGNVLNSTNVSLNLLSDYLKRSKHTDIGRVCDLLNSHKNDLADFLSRDPKGQRVPEFLSQLSQRLVQEHSKQMAELEALKKNISHIHEIVSVQQRCARISGEPERIKVEELLEDTLRLNAASLSLHQVEVRREFESVPPVTVDKHKVLQILVNLVCNAKQACEQAGRDDKKIILSVRNGEGRIKISVADNGIGIPRENLARIFTHGFTTKKNGHGFGLRSGAIAAREIGGSLTVHSEGTGQGSTFTLEIPCQPPAPQ